MNERMIGRMGGWMNDTFEASNRISTTVDKVTDSIPLRVLRRRPSSFHRNMPWS